MDIMEAYKSYILETNNDWLKLSVINDDEVQLTCQDVTAAIRFYNKDFQACEFTMTHNDEVIGYLHFEVTDLNHVKTLYDDFLVQLKKEAYHERLRVLLVCSVGGTTAFFASHLNEVAGTLSLDARFDSDGYMALYERADQFDVILVAPQVRYQYQHIKEDFPNHPVIAIPVDIFSKYDSAHLFFLLHDEGLL